jgi:2-polyprenyl-3-methyl-5-hydroxy-6-metoxy-1,4-benzoquinol methylase
MNYGEDDRAYRLRAQHELGETLLKRIPNQTLRVIDVGSYNRSNTHTCEQIDLEHGTLPFVDDTFDVAVSLDVIEHLWNTEHYLNEIQRAVKPSGYVILTTPNYNYIRYRVLCAIGRFDSFTYGSRHKKFFTTNSFKRLLNNRMDIINVIGTFAGKIELSSGLNLFAGQIGILGRFK